MIIIFFNTKFLSIYLCKYNYFFCNYLIYKGFTNFNLIYNYKYINILFKPKGLFLQHYQFLLLKILQFVKLDRLILHNLY